MACGSKPSAEVFFQTKAAVISSDSNAHVLSLFIRSQSEFVMSESSSRPLKPLPSSNFYPLDLQRRDPPRPQRDPSEPGRLESKYLQPAGVRAFLPFHC